MEMDAQIWSAFPPELLLYQVLPRLPLLHRLRLRPVCKTWSTLLLSNSYKIEHCNTTSAFSFLALFERKDSGPAHPDSELRLSVLHDMTTNTWLDIRKGGPEMQVLLYDHVANSWHRLSRPLIPHKMPHRINMNGYVPLTSAGGLICFQNVNNRVFKRLKLAVCNPVLHDWMNIPELVLDYATFGIMSAKSLCLYPKESGKGFFLALACPLFVFDSGTKCWTAVPTSVLPPPRSYYASKVLIIKGIAYILTFDEIYDDKGSSTLISPNVARYDLIQQETSLCSPLSKSTCLQVMPQLFELYGQVVLIGYDERYLICMWTYDLVTSVWRLLKTIAPRPPGWDKWKHFEFQNFGVFQSHNLFYFYTYVSKLDPFDCGCDTDYKYDSDCNCVCHSDGCGVSEHQDFAYELFDNGCNIFDVENNEWKKLPKGPYKGVGRRITTFTPTLHGAFEANSRKRKYGSKI